ncbi:urease accessory protein UreD [Dictyobacter formicarum]|uniref:Urease accessory protein UreD n=1 Tax=Dictyobacter formicarum TaxID=2778368 RepID=A0ABQ3VHK0_9CHLR|nr:urease accessory protein UreD [Dictyobacter formicarum]GHO85118.1 urease accessory protein UreD [Dictyobacter formicarum]
MRLDFTYDEATQRTRLQHSEQSPPLKVIRAFPLPTGGALVHLHNISGGVLAGDQLNINVNIGPAAYAQLTSTSATRLYRSLPESPPARQLTQIQVAQNGLLEYVPDPLIPFACARYQQQTRIQLAPGAGLFYWETIAPGRTARGELFEYDLLQLKCEIMVEDKPIAIEHIKLEPRRHNLSSLARLGPYNYFCNFYICKVGLDPARWLQLEDDLSNIAGQLTRPDEISWGVSTLTAHGLVIRALSKQNTALPAGLLSFWRIATQMLYGRDALPPRKIN